MTRVIPRSVENIVIALCADFERRAEAILTGQVKHRTEMEYRYLNYKIFTAAVEIVGDEANIYISEIGERAGYVVSETVFSEASYKEKKKRVKINIAKRLYLID